MAVDPGDLYFLTVLFHDSPHGSVEAFAEGTLEIREFDHLYRGIRAAHDMVLAIDWPHGASCRAPPLLFRLLLLGLEPLHRLEDYLRVVEKVLADDLLDILALVRIKVPDRSEEHTSELQSLMRISYAVFCLTKKNNNITKQNKIKK